MKKNICIFLLCILILTGCNKPDSDNKIFIEDYNEETAIEIDTTEKDDDTTQTPQELETEDAISEDITTEEPESLTVNLVVPEGYTLARIGMRLEDMGICTVDDFLKAAQEGDFSEFSLVAQQEYNPNRCYKLEGYLFPDTYEIYRTDSPDTIIRKMLASNERKYTDELRQQIKNSGFTVDEIITIASIIQKEAYERNDTPVPEEMPKVSSVLHNRLKDGMMLQCNVTATYVNGVLKEFVEDGFNRYNEYYNTYHCPALPAGAICNPGIDAIKSAVNPADTDYIFFLTDNDKNFYYSSNFEEHSVLVEKHMPKE